MKNGLVSDRMSSKQWYQNDVLHREDGPAVELFFGTKEWYWHGKLHRTDGPAIEHKSFMSYCYAPINEWYANDERHRENGPAIEYPNGDEFWFFKNKLHRVGGPAITLTEGTKFYYHHGLRHRNNGPAVSWNDGTKEWWLNGKLHRINGPALEFADGSTAWYFHGLRHRENGPAVKCSNGQHFYFLFGLQVSEELIKGKSTKDKKGRWFVGDLLHRVDGPAIENSRQKEWYIGGKRHRTDGPAVEHKNGRKEYWLFGIKVPAYVVIKPEQITLEKILKTKAENVRFLMIEKFGWHNFFIQMKIRKTQSKQCPEDKKSMTLFVLPFYGNLVVIEDLDKHRVHTFRLPDDVDNCKKAHDYLKNSKKLDWNQELMSSPFILSHRMNWRLFQYVSQKHNFE